MFTFFRAHMERGGGAWCPSAMVHNDAKEYLELDLVSLHTLTKVEVQGRFGNGQGREYAEKFKLQYWRDDLNRWVDYKNGKGQNVSNNSVHICYKLWYYNTFCSWIVKYYDHIM